jgi:toxin ParE1/3/4
LIKLRVHEAAALSIVEQADYYREQAGSPLALKWESAINEAVRSLLKLPEIGSPCRFRCPSLAEIRWVLVPNFPKHMVFYRYDKAESTIHIIEVLHGARDIDSILGEEEAAM